MPGMPHGWQWWHQSGQLLSGNSGSSRYDDYWHFNIPVESLSRYTVESVLKDHPIGHKNVVCQDRWSLVTGSVILKCGSFCQKCVVFQDRWSLMAVVSQDRFHCTNMTRHILSVKSRVKYKFCNMAQYRPRYASLSYISITTDFCIIYIL